MSAIEPGRTTISEVIALYGKPVAKNPQGGRNMQANFSSYSGTLGYSAVQYNADTGVIYKCRKLPFRCGGAAICAGGAQGHIRRGALHHAQFGLLWRRPRHK